MSPKSRRRYGGKINSHNVTRTDEMRRIVQRGFDTESKRDDRLPDRQTALLLAIQEILGMTQTLYISITVQDINVVSCDVAR